MSIDAREAVKSTQEQAVAAWIGYLNQLRIDGLLAALKTQDSNLKQALKTLKDTTERIDVEIVARNRGGTKGMHGFIAEVAEVGVNNARREVIGKGANMSWVNDNGKVDLIRDGIDIQQKFVNAGGRFSLGAVAQHLQAYPDFVRNGGKYQIPSDHYDSVKRLLVMSKEEAARLSKSSDSLSIRDWERVHNFFGNNNISIDDLEPSQLSYKDVQVGRYSQTLKDEGDKIRATDQSLRSKAYQESLPTFAEGAKATTAAAVIEGGTAFVMKVTTIRKRGKKLCDFDSDDWAEIAGETGKGLAKGGARGASVYVLTNYTATSAAVASSLVTASFGVAEQAHRFRSGEIGEVEFIENAESLCLDTSISALSSAIGQVAIPVPVLGAIIGNTVGTVMYQIAKEALSENERELFATYTKGQQELDAKLRMQYDSCLADLRNAMASYLGLLDFAFDPDPLVAFEGSIELARELGVPAEDILDTPEKAMAYFMD